MRQLAGFFPATAYPNVLVGLGEPDDAAVYQLDDERALIQTTDFFTPIVDDPWTYGAIAAANAMSDVYAMGGEVLFCLNLAGFPAEMKGEVIAQIFAGGATKVREAGAAITGGHTINSPEPFYGLSVTGLIHPDQVIRKGGARPGDRLFLTKPLGTGIVTTAAKLTGAGESAESRQTRHSQGRPDIDMSDLDAAVISMLKLNRGAARAAVAAGVQGGTDITGFGLLGHSVEMMLSTGGTGFRIHAADVPALPGVWDYIAARYLTRGSTRNPEHFGQHVRFAESVTPAQRTLLWEAETSGGLLLAVPPGQAERFRDHCLEQEERCWEIGEVLHSEGVEVV
ncbi:MAG: selenide, water dikinase SelD [Chloroflexi bacterium]|nr:MAG: selenide, water dikinase SelD [Chloroflexota bacterium]